MFRLKSRRSRAIAAVLVTAAAAVAVQELSREFSFWDEKIAIAGVPNAGRVTPHLYRGAQPAPEGFAALRAMGVDTVVRMNQGDADSAAERALVTGLGMTFVDLPWSTQRPPPEEHVTAFLALVRDHPEKTIFIHCKSGVDRTGVMVALSRITFDHWTTERAVAEMNAFHYHFVFLPHLQRYVERFARERRP